MKKNKLDSKYSASKIDEEDSIIEEIDEDFERDDDQFSSSSKNMIKSRPKHKRKSVSKPVFGKKSKQFHESGKSLLNKLKDTSMNDFISTLTKGIDAQYKEEYDKLVKEFSNNKIDDYMFAQKKRVLVDWKAREIKDIHKKRMLIEGWVQMSEIVAKMKEEESIGHSSGSIRDLRKAPQLLFSKPDYSIVDGGKDSEEEYKVEDDSDDSFGLRRAKKQLRDIYRHENPDDSADEDIIDEADIKIRKKALKKKKITAERLLKEKEKAIQEGLKQKLIELDEKHAQDLLEEAIEIDVKGEIERRFNLMLEIDAQSIDSRRKNEVLRGRKLEDSIEDSSLGYSFKPSKITESADTNIHPEFDESIKSLENKKKGRNLNKLVVPAKSKNDQIIEDTVAEDAIQEELDAYSNDFDSISASATNIDAKLFKKPEEKIKPELVKKIAEVKDDDSEIQSEIIEDYSEDFDASDTSSKISNNIQDLTKKPIEEIKEVAAEDENESGLKPKSSESRTKGQEISQQNSGSLIDETPNDSSKENSSNEEIIKRIPTGKSDDFIQMVSESGSSYDKEVLEGSHPSVDWVIDAVDQKLEKEKLTTIEEEKNKETDDSKKKETIEDDIDEEYEDDFEEFSDGSDEAGSTPRVGEKEPELDIMEDHEKLADIIAEELFKSIDSAGLFDKTKKIVQPRDFTEEDFKDKFPFAKPIKPKVDLKMEISTQVDFFQNLTQEILKPKNSRALINKILRPKKLDMLDEFRKLKVSKEDEDEMQPGDDDDLLNEKIFKIVVKKSIDKLISEAEKEGKEFSEDKIKAVEIHSRALYSSFNEIFLKMIPAGLKPNPLHWVSKDQAFKSEGRLNSDSFTENDLRKILKRVVKKLKSIINIPQEGKDRMKSKQKNDDEISPEKEAMQKNKIKEENL